MIRLIQLFSSNHTVFIYGHEKYFELNSDKNVKDFINKIEGNEQYIIRENSQNIHMCKNLNECMENSDVIISGMPLSKDNETINCSYSDKCIKLKQVYEKMTGKTFIAGGIPIWFYENENIRNMDLLQSEELTILNAISTVEGTIKIAIEETEDTIFESNIMIFGFGRIGKILCKRFKSMGANVYCVARKEEDLTWIREGGYIPLEYKNIEEYANKIDIVINTVPAIILKENEIKNMKKTSIIIDVASNPGGVDKTIAKGYNIKVITALGIPGKIAPNATAKCIKQIIEKNIEI